MEFQPVKSKNVAAIGYDPATQTLGIRFHNESSDYFYEHVPPALHVEFMKSESKGAFLHARVRGQFNHRKVERPKT